MQQLPNPKLGDILISAGVLTEVELMWGLEQQKHAGQRLGRVLVDCGLLSEDDLIEAIAFQIDMPCVHLGDIHIDSEMSSLISESLARTYKLIPITVSKDKMAVAMANPTDVEAIDTVQRAIGKRVEPVLASATRIDNTLDKVYGEHASEQLADTIEQAADSLEIEAYEDKIDTDVAEERRQSDQAPVVKTVNLILQEAVNLRASDVHVEPRATCVEIRYRIDGALRLARTVPKRLESAVASRIKIMAEMDIAEKRKPQDGRAALRMGSRSVDLRVSTFPTQHGERVVMRILDKQAQHFSIGQLGFVPTDKESFESLIRRPHGLILVTGPTGSGKTTTLYSALSEIGSSEINIMTCEDPIEYDMPGVNQSQVNVRAKVTFASQLRAILRQDPDVVLVGEIRDQETAEIAFQAAMTGHLVLSSLHCNNAPGAITRLLDMGTEPFLISSSLIGATAQRLLRLLCPKCKIPYTPTADELSMLPPSLLDGPAQFYAPKGCSSCGQLGYAGRAPIVELMVMSRDIKNLIMLRSTSEQIMDSAVRDGMTTMRVHAAQRLAEGVTSFEEVKKKVYMRTDG